MKSTSLTARAFILYTGVIILMSSRLFYPVSRLNEIIALQNRLSAEANARCVGKTYEVLVEGVSKRSRDQLFGRTEQNRVVVFDRGTHRVGDFVMVKVTESSSATLKGEEVAG